jgi:hypothetical protein
MFFVCKNMFKVSYFPVYNTVFSSEITLKTESCLMYEGNLEKKNTSS